jgi:Tol biopolymer transport system component/outer membrane biosynthesis protein TonB
MKNGRIQTNRQWRLLSGLLILLLMAGAIVMPLSLISTPVAAQSSMEDGKMAVVGLDGAALQEAPGGKDVAQLTAGDVLTALSRSADSKYLQVKTERGVEGWVATSSVVVFGIDALPVVEPPKPATATPAPTATKPPTPTAQPSPTAQPTPTSQPTPTALPRANQAAESATEAEAATPVKAATPAGTGTATANAGEGIIGVVIGTGATLYDAPDGEALQSAPGAEAISVTGRDSDGAWLMVTTLDGSEGWMRASDLVVFGVDELPVMSGQESVEKPATASPNATGAITTTAAMAAIVQPAATVTTTTTATNTATTVIEPPTTEMTGTANVSGSRLNIRAGAGSAYRIIGKASSGEELAVAARSEDDAWLLIVREDLPQGAGWVSAGLVRLDGAVSELPASADEFTAAATTPPPGAPAPSAPVQATPTRAPAASTPAQATATPSASAEATQIAPATEAPTVEPPATAPPATEAPTAVAPAASTRTGATGLTGTIVFQDGRGGIHAYDLERGEVRQLTSGYDPAISRDGSKVAVLRGDGIYSINIDGSGERKVFASSDLITSPKWSPDGNWIVFTRMIGEYKCWQTEFFGCITLRELRERFPFAPPAVLQKIFLSGYDRVAIPNIGLTRINADGGEFRDIAALDSAQAPDWNEDGIVYQSKAGIEVTQDKPDGETRSVQWGNWDWDPDWAPNGGPIVYQSKEGPHWEIFSINPDGSGVFALTRPVTTLVDELPSNVAPAFSPDGQNIVYLSNRQDDNEAGPWRLWVMDAGGGNQRPLPLDMEIDYGFGGEQVASWGP